MKARFLGLGLACLLGSALAVPTRAQQTQHAQQIQTVQQEPPAPDDIAPGDVPTPSDPVLSPPDESMQAPDSVSIGVVPQVEGQGARNMDVNNNMDVEAFREMVNQVQQQVQQIGQLVRQQSGNQTTPEAILATIAEPLARLNQTIAVGVKRLGVRLSADLLSPPGAGHGASRANLLLLGNSPVQSLLSDLLQSLGALLDAILIGPIGRLIGGLLSSILGGAVGGGGGAAVDVSELLDDIISKIEELLPEVGVDAEVSVGVTRA
ncbi:hypothetical protein MMYC01_206085 [Madurella mycetomatis]|uniref:Uncharacterized protein n=1 Tax=Madurella mycetomatis TaxID=100816 RepID=A0A175W141_9PEZI|nr:hypothetical protein MMYC01_206085 [Madurella mycetomatis]